MADPTFPLFPIMAGLGSLLVLVPLPWHLQAWNSGTCYYMMWTALACLNQFVNSIVWSNDAINKAPIWCDISTRITLAAAFGIPASALCIMRRLHSISRVHSVATTHAEKQRAILVDTSICVLFPMIQLVLAYIVQGHRFDIVERYGCYPSVYNSLLSYFLVSMWPLVLGLTSAVYCILTLRTFLQRQAQFTEFLSSNKSLTASRYFRLMALAGVELMCTTPISVFQIYLNTTAYPLSPWRSWADTHSDFGRVDLLTEVIWIQNRTFHIAAEVGRWAPVFCAMVFFAFFGFARECRSNYLKLLRSILIKCRIVKEANCQTSSGTSKLRRLALSSVISSSPGTLPVFTPPPRYQSPDIPPATEYPHEKGFVPLSSAGTITEFSFSTSEGESEVGSPSRERTSGSLSSKASSTSIVDYTV